MKTEARLRKRERLKRMKGSDENEDIISKLPDELLAIILSKLQVDEAVRCNILSKRWLGLWKKTPHMEINARHMIRPLTQLQHGRESLTNPDLTTLNPLMQKRVFRYGFYVLLLLYRHSGVISSCRFVHFQKSLEFGEVNTWIKVLVDKMKRLKDLSLECVPNYGETKNEYRSSEDEIRNPQFLCGIFNCLTSLELINYTIDSSSAFEDCHNLKVLKLKRITLDDGTLSGILENCVVLENFSLVESIGFKGVIIMKSELKVLCLQALYVDHLEVVAQNLGVLCLDSVICPTRNVSIVAPSLQNFQYHWYSSLSRMLPADKFHKIVKYYNVRSETPIRNVFQNLSTMKLDLNLNLIEESSCLSYVLRLCTSLQVLEINLPVFEGRKSSGYTFDNFGSPYPIEMFWEKQYNHIIQKLKFVYIKGFRGQEQEVKFAKYLITRGLMMKKLTIIFCNNSTEEAENLLSLPRASRDLSIQLKFNESIN